MTLTETDEHDKMQHKPQNHVTIGHALRDTIWQGLEQGRLTCGMFQCAKFLEINPINVMVCVLPGDIFGDVSVHIHHTLIEAFCLENGIRLARVDSEDKLSKAVSGCASNGVNDNDMAAGRVIGSDVNCLIVQYPDEDLSPTDVTVMAYLKGQISKMTGPASVINLP